MRQSETIVRKIRAAPAACRWDASIKPPRAGGMGYRPRPTVSANHVAPAVQG